MAIMIFKPVVPGRRQNTAGFSNTGRFQNPGRRLSPFVLAGFFAVLALLPGCAKTRLNGTLMDGYYSAETSGFDSFGWKEFITIYVNGGRIVSVEYNGKNSSGLIKSWDPFYMRRMNEMDGTYPTEYTRVFSSSLISRQNPDSIDTVSGASTSHETFRLLAKAAIEQSKNGSRQVAVVPLPPKAAGHNE
ncbi:MAG: FMN-binding protein [Treponema sp.]|jgi:major membrane immunogen (membrane-anchored lipoprotein)|nr:FMN-binding protein [Treponema sp.]